MRFSEDYPRRQLVVDKRPAYAGETGAVASGSFPNPEVAPKPRRRTLSAAYKAALLAELDACGPGEAGAILRREGIYSSSISEWRKQRRDGSLMAAQRGPKPLVPVQAPTENKELLRENRRLKRELETAHMIIDIQKKLSMLMEARKSNDES